MCNCFLILSSKDDLFVIWFPDTGTGCHTVTNFPLKGIVSRDFLSSFFSWFEPLQALDNSVSILPRYSKNPLFIIQIFSFLIDWSLLIRGLDGFASWKKCWSKSRDTLRLKGECHENFDPFYHKTSPGPHKNRQKWFLKFFCFREDIREQHVYA